jgi:hypothetical protein
MAAFMNTAENCWKASARWQICTDHAVCAGGTCAHYLQICTDHAVCAGGTCAHYLQILLAALRRVG